MNRRDLEKHLSQSGCRLYHHGGRHDIWINAETLARASVPRHQTIKKGTVRGICRRLGAPTPPGI